MPDDQLPQSAVGALLGSGFPLQTAVAAVVGGTPGWTVDAVELPWTDSRSDRTEFLDIVAKCADKLVAIECKKTKEATYTFLLPDPGGPGSQVGLTARASLVHTWDFDRDLRLRGSSWGVGPESYESMFCAISGCPPDQRQMEKYAGTLLRATDTIAVETYTSYMRMRPSSSADLPPLLYIPVLVTNARLFVAPYATAQVSLLSGTFEGLPEAMPAPWVRFRKNFGPTLGTDLGERTLFVVSAAELAGFLTQLAGVRPRPPSTPGPWLRLQA